jgi:hypothetical protein
LTVTDFEKRPVDETAELPERDDEERTDEEFRWGTTMTDAADDDQNGADDPVRETARTIPNPPI